MAVTSAAPTLERSTLEDSRALDDQWRQIDDDEEWSSQLKLSNDHAPYNDTDMQPDDTHNSRNPEPTDHLSQQAPMKLNLLTRPVSSHEDLDAGFSFAKAKPKQCLDFSREPKQNTAAHANDVSNLLPPATEKMLSRNSPPTSNVTEPTQDTGTATSPSKEASNKVTVRAVPFPNIHGTVSFEHASTTGGATAPIGPPPSKLPTNDVSMSAGNTPVRSDFNEVNSTHQQYTQDSAYPNRPPDMHYALGYPPNEVMSTSHHPQNAPRKPAIKAPRVARTAVPGASRVTKNRKKKVTGVPRNNAAFQPLPAAEDSNEEMFFLLMNRVRQDRRESEAKDVALETSNRQCQMLAALNDDLDARLHDVSRLCSEKEAQLSKIKAAKPGWETKIRKLSEYVKGLTNDHNRLRDDARDVREQSGEILKEKKCLHDALQEVSQTTTEQHKKSRKLVTEARHDLEILEQKVQHQQSDLRNKQELLVAEQERNLQLEGQISEFAAGAASQEHLAELLLGHRDTITRKIDKLLEKTEIFRAAAPAESQDQLRPMLEQCLTVLQNLQSSDAAKPENYEKLQDSMRGYFDSIIRSTEICAHNTTITEAGHQQLASLMEEQLRDLRSNLASDTAFSEQVMDLREVKATLRERLQGTNSALRDARIESIALKQKAEDQQRKLITLETDLAKTRQLTENPVTLLRLQDLDSHNKALQQKITSLQTKAASLSTQLQQRVEDAQGLNDSFVSAQAQIQEARRETEAVRKEKLESERHALQQNEETKRTLLNAASIELANVKSEHLSTIQQIKARKSPADDKLSHVTKQFIILQGEKEKVDKEASMMKLSLDGLQKERQHETAFAERLRARVAELEKQNIKQAISNKRIQHELDASNQDVNTKVDYTKHLQSRENKLQALQKKKPQKPPTRTEPSPSSQSPSRSKHFTKPLPAVVEDSQPSGYPVSTTPIDVEEASQPITEDDLKDFWPDTPAAWTEGRKVPSPSLQQSGNKSSRKIQICPPLKHLPKNGRSALSETIQLNGASGGNLQGSASTLSSNHELGTTVKPSSQAGQLQRPRQGSAIMPRGSAKGAREGKRNASRAGLNDSSKVAVSKRTKSSVARPATVVADSQSPVHPLSSRTRMQTKTTKRNTKDDQMKNRFSQELRRSEDR